MLVVALLVLIVTYLYINTRKPKGFPPGPPRYPIVGYGPFLEKHLVHKHMWRLSSIYGPVLGLYLGPQPTVVVHGWEALKESLGNDDLNGRPQALVQQLRDGGKQRGVMFTEGELWKDQRRFALHHFRNLGLGKRSHETVIHEEASDLLKEILEEEGSVELQVKVGVSNVNILWALMGGSRFNRKDPELTNLVDRLNQTFRAGEVGGSIVQVFPFLRHVMPKTSKFGIVMEGLELVNKFMKKNIEEHKRTLDQENPRDFIDIYLIEMYKNNNNNIDNHKDNNKNEPPKTFSEQELMAVCNDIFAAGTETGSASVSFAVLLSCLYPDTAEKLHDELDSVVGRDRLPCVDDRPRLVYTEAFLAEVFRFRGVAPFTVPHSAQRDTTLQGYQIPANTMVLNNLYSILMDKDYWGDPENFRPERFINPDGTLRKDERLIIFGKGRRVCLGESLARMTLYLLFTALMQKFTFDLDPAVPVENTEGIAGFTLGPPPFRVFTRSRF